MAKKWIKKGAEDKKEGVKKEKKKGPSSKGMMGKMYGKGK